jgi:hypothetical protein
LTPPEEDVGAHALVLLHSPLLGPAVWRPVREELRKAGWPVADVEPYGRVRSPADVLAAMVAQVPPGSGAVLVPHSNAGPYVAALAAARPVAAAVFVDAGLPADGPTTPVAPAALRDLLAGLADDAGTLPPWTSWWPAEEVATLFPDEPTRRAVEAEQARLPLAYFDDAVPSTGGWDTPAAYLAFGDTYAEERARAVRRGWPVETLAGGHLHQLRAPGEVAAALERLLAALGVRAPGTAAD